MEKDERTEIPTTEDELSAVFEDAKAAGESLDGADASMDDAIANPLRFIDYLILEGETISFNSEYSRSSDPAA